MTFNKISSLLISLIASVVILIYLQSLLIPIIYALLLWFLSKKIKFALDKIPFIKKHFSSWAKSLFTALIIFSALGFISIALSSSISNLAYSYVKYETNISLITNKINIMFDIDIFEITKKQIGDLNFGMILSSLINALSSILGNAFMILLYTLFIFLEETHFNKKIKAIFTNHDQYLKVNLIIKKVEKSIADYIGLKTFVSLITGILSYFVLLALGIDSPFFWAILIFLLNFIPTIGSIIGTVFPAIFSLFQFGDFTPFFLILIFIGFIQIIIGNLLEPKLMSNSLNISTLVTFISLSLWGTIWGITGMLLCIPITVIIVIICSHFEKTKPIAIILSSKGEIN